MFCTAQGLGGCVSSHPAVAAGHQLTCVTYINMQCMQLLMQLVTIRASASEYACLPFLHLAALRSCPAAAGHIKSPGAQPRHCDTPSSTPRAPAAAASTSASSPPVTPLVSLAAATSRNSTAAFSISTTAAGNIFYQAADQSAAARQGFEQPRFEAC